MLGLVRLVCGSSALLRSRIRRRPGSVLNSCSGGILGNGLSGRNGIILSRRPILLRHGAAFLSGCTRIIYLLSDRLLLRRATRLLLRLLFDTCLIFLLNGISALRAETIVRLNLVSAVLAFHRFISLLPARHAPGLDPERVPSPCANIKLTHGLRVAHFFDIPAGEAVPNGASRSANAPAPPSRPAFYYSLY